MKVSLSYRSEEGFRNLVVTKEIDNYTIIDIQNRAPAVNDMMSTELKYYYMNNLTCVHFIYWFEIAIPNVFTPLQCRYNQP